MFRVRYSSTSFKPKDNTQAELKQLWGGKVPSLTPAQIELSLKLWQKIKTRKQREQNLESEKKVIEVPVKPRN